MKPYSVYTPPFDPTSGGIRVMWGLYGWLLAKGQIVHVNARYETEDFIAIYPEIAHGNPLQANHVVRYILNKPGLMASNGIPGPTSFLPTDKLYYFSRLFGETDDEHYMFLPILNTHLFKDYGKKRTKKAVFYGKGGNQNQHPDDCIPIDRRFASNQQALADLLNECEVLYSYDSVTAMHEIARLCGCRILLIQNDYTPEEWQKYEPGTDGISFGKDLGIAVHSGYFRDRYMSMKKDFEFRLDRFIEETQS